VTRLGAGRYSVADGVGRRRIAYAAVTPDAVWVHLDGDVHVVKRHARRDGEGTRHEHDDASLAPPMPATVVSVAVQVGQAVTRGDVLVTLEAMKMELPVRAPRDGRVRSIACRAGQLVQPGVPLLELESEPDIGTGADT
jgi:biotin carboxyl carrier protein